MKGRFFLDMTLCDWYTCSYRLWGAASCLHLRDERRILDILFVEYGGRKLPRKVGRPNYLRTDKPYHCSTPMWRPKISKWKKGYATCSMFETAVQTMKAFIYIYIYIRKNNEIFYCGMSGFRNLLGESDITE